MREIRYSPFPPGYDFESALAAQTIWGGLTPPKATLGGAMGHISGQVTAQDILDSQMSTKFVYMFDTVRYRDIFPATKTCITEFCWQITATGDPLAFLLTKPTKDFFSYALHNEVNRTRTV